jgi:hypothetical protein
MTQIVATFTDCGSSIICIGSIAFNSDQHEVGVKAPKFRVTLRRERTTQRSESREKTN